MAQKEISHTETHSKTKRKIDPSDVQIRFAPDVVKSFGRLEAMVHDSPHFSPALLENLQDIAAGKPLPVQVALSEMAILTRETLNHVRETGDTRAEQALNDCISELMGITHFPEKNTVSVVVGSPAVARK